MMLLPNVLLSCIVYYVLNNIVSLLTAMHNKPKKARYTKYISILTFDVLIRNNRYPYIDLPSRLAPVFAIAMSNYL